MANFYRLIRSFFWFLVGFAIVAFPMFSYASTPASYYWLADFTVGSPQFGSYTEACTAGNTARIAQTGDQTGICTITGSPPEMTCNGNLTVVGCGTVVALVGVHHRSSCPAGETKSGVYPNEVCTASVDCSAGDPTSGTYFSGCYAVNASGGGCDAGASVMPSVACDGSCSFKIDAISSCSAALGVGPINCNASGTKNGSTCSMTGSNALPPDTQQCPPGYLVGSLNGKKGCYKSGPGQTATTSTTSATTGDTTTKTSTTVDPNKNTTTTTTTTTNNTTGDTNITSSSAPTDPSKPIGAAPDDDINNDDFCVKNPTSPLCATSKFCEQNPDISICKKGVWSGGCGAFVCDGDAIQCAIAREQHQRNCVLFDTATPLSDLGDALAAGTDSGVDQNPAKSLNRVAVNLPGHLNTSKSISAVCMPDLIVQVMSSSLVIPFSNICQYLEIMGRIVIAFSLIAAGRIVSGGVA